MRYLAIFCASMMFAQPCLAAGHLPPQRLSQLVVESATFNGETIVSKKKMLGLPVVTDVEVSMPDAVRLTGDVPADVEAKVANEGASSLSSGQVLYSAGGNKVIYCGRAKGFPELLAPCLLDSDGDGQFDTAFDTRETAIQPDVLTLSSKKIFGMELRAPIALPAPVPYERLDNSVAPRVKAKLVWFSDFNKETPDKPTHLEFLFWADTNGIGAISPSVRVTYSGIPVDVNVYGLKIKILRIGKDGELTSQVTGQVEASPIPFMFRDFYYNVIYY